jgi:hypothetical protein
MRHAAAPKKWPILLLLAALAFACAPLPAGAQTTLKPDRRTSMKIRIELPRQRYIAKEAMQARVSITNDGAQPIEVPDPAANVNWQPTYLVKGPSFPDGRVFSFRSVVYGGAGSDAAGRQAMTLAIAPGQTHSADFPLEQLVAIAKPGEYLLAAALEWGGLKARSDPVSFTIESPDFRSLQLVTAPALQPAFPINVFALTGGAGARVYLATFAADQNTGQIALKSLSNFVPSAPGATTVFGPWMNFHGMGTPAPRAGWQAGATLGLAGFGEPPVSVSLPSAPRIVRPALMTGNGDTDVFALEDAAGRLSMVRFPEAGGPKVVWTQALPGKVVAASAALGPAQRGDSRIAVVISGRADGLAATLVDAGQGGAAPKLRTVEVAGVQAFAGSEPAARVRADGSVQAALVVTQPASAGAGRRAAVLDLAWPADAAALGQGTVTPIAADLSAQPRAAAAAYTHASGAKDRRDWALVLDNGEVVSAATGNRQRLSGRAVEPVQLFVGTQGTYLLTLTDEQLPAFEPLR